MKPVRPDETLSQTTPRPRLTLNKETLRQLSSDDLRAVAGGGRSNGCVSYQGNCPSHAYTCSCPPPIKW